MTLDELKQGIKNIPQDAIPFTLDEWRIPKDDLPFLAIESFTKGRMENNIVDLSEQDVLSILKNIY